MGAKGSGRTRESYTRLAEEGAPEGQQTAETKAHLAQVRAQAGDRLFEVVRVNADGSKDELGTVSNTRLTTIGATFGAGEYELYEIERGTELRTKRPPVKKILHPGAWPFNPKFAKSARLLEQEFIQGMSPALGAAPGGVLAGRSPEELVATARAQAKKEFEDEQRIKDLTAAHERTLKAVEDLKMNGTGGAAGGGRASMIDELKTFFALFNEMRGPQMNSIVSPKSPIESIKEAIETVKLFDGELTGLKLGGKEKNPMLEKLAESLTSIGTEFAKSKMNPQRQVMLPPGPPQRPQAMGAVPSGAPAATAEQQGNQQVEELQRELFEHLAQDQAAELAGSPGSSVTQTATWLKTKWTPPYATQAWTSLKNLVDQYPASAVVEYLGHTAPHLVSSPEKKAWLARLVDLVKQK